MTDFLMPSLGSDMQDGTLIEWEKKPGDTVKKGDVLAVVETQKGAIEIEAFDEGVLGKLLVQAGEKVPVGTPLALIDSPTGAPGLKPATDHIERSLQQTKKSLQQNTQRPDTNKAREPSLHKSIQPIHPPSRRIRISPAARKLARQANLDLTEITGTGPAGAIVLSDINDLLEKSDTGRAKDTGTTEDSATEKHISAKKIPMEGMRAAIAAAMSRSKREIPHYYLAHTFSLQNALDYVARENSTRPPETRLLPGALFVKAVAKAAHRFPEFNGHFEDNKFNPSEAVHAGMAISIRGGGLVAPAIHDADKLTLDSLMDTLRDLVSRVRGGRFRSSELSDPTITISSLGARGVDSLYGVIYPPQVAIVGFGTPAQRPQLGADGVYLTTMVNVTLAADHRVSDGHRGSLFLNAIAKYMQSPEAL